MSVREPLVFQGIPGIRSPIDRRNPRIDDVGIKGVRYQLTVKSGGKPSSTVVTLALTVGLSASENGTNMSRFIEILEAQTDALDPAGFKGMEFDVLDRLNAKNQCN